MSRSDLLKRHRILIVERLLFEFRHEGINVPEIQQTIFDRYGADIDRKTIYDDIKALRLFFDIQSVKDGRNIKYKVIIKEKTAPQQNGTVPKQKQKTSREVTK